MKLRPYQQLAVDRTLESFKTHQAVMTVLATGLGKTIIMANIAQKAVNSGRTMLIAHREELIHQSRDKFETVLGDRVDVEMASSYAKGGWFKSNAVVATVQTLGRRMDRFDPNEFSMLFVDENHHSVSSSYVEIINYFKKNPNLKIYGTTATPDRTDEEALGQIFDDVSFEYGILDGITDGWLVPIEQRQVYVDSLDLSWVHTQMGDLNNGELSKILEYEKNIHGVAAPTIELCGNKKTLVFAASVAQAERLTEILNRHKSGSAFIVTGKTDKDKRRQMLKAYNQGQFQYLVNVGVATEGFDEPGIEMVVMARPTKSRCLFTQCIGRGTRPAADIAFALNDCDDSAARRKMIENSSKRCVQVLDFVGNSGKHKLVHAADVLGGKYPDEVVERAQKNIDRSATDGRPADVISELQKAEQEIAQAKRDEKERAIRQGIKIGAKYNTRNIDPFDLFDMTPHRIPAWHKNRAATPGQIAALQKFGVDTTEINDFTHASQLMDTLCGRAKQKLCTYKQAKVLKRYGVEVTELTAARASMLIDEIAKNGWKLPERYKKAQ